MDKKKIARQVAIKHPTNLVGAVLEYARKTGTLSIIKVTDGNNENFNKIVQEMLDHIGAPYRHPMSKEQVWMNFFGPASSVSMTGYNEPEYLQKLKALPIPEEIIQEVEQYVADFERLKICNEECCEELRNYEFMFDEVRHIYNKNRDERSEKRNALVAQVLGLSSGKFPARFDKETMYRDYVRMIRHEGLSREDAVENVMNRHVVWTYDATLRHLHDYRKQIDERIKKEWPQNFEEIKETVKGLIPYRTSSS